MTESFRRITENTGLPIKIVLPIVGSVIAATVWIQSSLAEIKQIQRESWTTIHMQTWRDRFSAENPSLKIPTVFDITQHKAKQ